MNMTAPNGRFLGLWGVPEQRGRVFGGNAYTYSDFHITKSWVVQMQKDIAANKDTVNFLTRFKSDEYVIIVDVGFIDPRECEVGIHLCARMQRL